MIDPSHRALASLSSLALVVPFLSRIPGLLLVGADWWTSFAPSASTAAFVMGSAILVIPVFAAARVHSTRALWLVAVPTLLTSAGLYGTLDLETGSRGAIRLVLCPLANAVVALVCLALALMRQPRERT